MELRREPRFPVRFRSSLIASSSRNYGGTILNLSRSGCKVHSYLKVLTGMDLRLCLYLPGEERSIEIERALVRWTRGVEFGLQFLDMQSQDSDRLFQFISALQKSPNRESPIRLSS